MSRYPYSNNNCIRHTGVNHSIYQNIKMSVQHTMYCTNLVCLGTPLDIITISLTLTHDDHDAAQHIKSKSNQSLNDYDYTSCLNRIVFVVNIKCYTIHYFLFIATAAETRILHFILLFITGANSQPTNHLQLQKCRNNIKTPSLVLIPSAARS